jgi:alpha-tubulin suppressor-like RCC1 family protein
MAVSVSVGNFGGAAAESFTSAHLSWRSPGIAISTASDTSTALDSWGDNSAGELGDGSLTQSVVPTLADTSAEGTATITAIAAGGRHDLALLANNTVLAWGDDTDGQLGNGSASANDDAETPTVVPNLTDVVAVAAGGQFSLALLSNGTVDAWGDNSKGQLGDGSTTDSDVPVPVKGLTGATSISAGDQVSLAVLGNGTVKSWGFNNDAQLGDGTKKNSDVPVAVTGLTGVHAVSAGTFHALALLNNGTVEAWGDNSSDELGDGQDGGLSAVPVAVVGLSGVTAVAAGENHSAALLSNGTVDAWGENNFFELGRPQANSPGGFNDSDVPLAVPDVSNATAIAAGPLYNLTLSDKGTVEAWGDNAFGQLGNDSDATNSPVVEVKDVSGATAIAAGGAQSVALVPATTGGPASPTATPDASSSPWSVVPTPTPAPGVAQPGLLALSASSPTDAWAVGSSSARQPAGEHWNGTSWTIASFAPGPVAPSDLSGVDDLSPTNAWAVGTSAIGGSERTLIEHWDGTSWSIVPSPDPSIGMDQFDSLSGISGTSPDDLWAVGTFNDAQGNLSGTALLLVHWNGTSWTFFPPPTAGTQIGAAVTVISPDDAWAVGDTLGGTVSLHWNGTVWSAVTTPTLKGRGTVTNLTDITNAGPHDIWASGFAVTDNVRTPYLLRSTGRVWKLVEVPNAGSEGSQLSGVAALSATDVWASGVTEETDGGALALIEHFNGTSWSIVPALEPGQLASISSNSFGAITATGTNTLFALGGQSVPRGSDVLVEEDTAAG